MVNVIHCVKPPACDQWNVNRLLRVMIKVYQESFPDYRQSPLFDARFRIMKLYYFFLKHVLLKFEAGNRIIKTDLMHAEKFRCASKAYWKEDWPFSSWWETRQQWRGQDSWRQVGILLWKELHFLIEVPLMKFSDIKAFNFHLLTSNM